MTNDVGMLSFIAMEKMDLKENYRFMLLGIQVLLKI